MLRSALLAMVVTVVACASSTAQPETPATEMCPCPAQMWEEMGLGGPPVNVRTGVPSTREDGLLQLRSCRASLDEVRKVLDTVERRAHERKDVVMSIAARDHSSQAFAMARHIDEDLKRFDDAELEGTTLTRVGVDCDRVSELAREVPQMIAIDCGCPAKER